MPHAKAGEVAVAVEASSATTSDSIVGRGLSPYLGDTEPPFTLGYDFVGAVSEVGEGVEGFDVGDRVVAITRWGANADTVVAKADQLTPIDTALAAPLIEPMVMTGATAATMVRRMATVGPGDVVFVQGGSGGVGLLAVQAALAFGATVIASASPAKHPALNDLGVLALDYDDPDVYARIRDVAPDGVQLVIDGAGGQSVQRAGQVLADGATLITYGFAQVSRLGLARSPEAMETAGRVFAESSAAIEELNNSTRGLRALQFDITGQREQDPTGYRDDVQWLIDLVESGQLHPTIETLPLEAAADAHRRLDAGDITGRLVLDHRI